MCSMVSMGAQPPQGMPLSSSWRPWGWGGPLWRGLCILRLESGGRSLRRWTFIIKCFSAEAGKGVQWVVNGIQLQRFDSCCMSDIKPEDIEANFDRILGVTGEESYVDWAAFTKNSTSMNKTLEELAKKIAILRDVQQKKFIATMKKLKTADVPDLIKTVKAKKLPKEALKSIASRFTLKEGQLDLIASVEDLKTESKNLFTQYISENQEAETKARETVEFLTKKIKDSGLYEEPQEPKELVSTFKHTFSEEKLEEAKKSVEVKYLPNTVDTIHITTYAQIVDASFTVVKDEYKRLTEEARIKQRTLLKDAPKYLEALTEYLTNTEVLIIDGQKALAAKVGLSGHKLEEVEGILMERGLGQNILFVQSGLRTKVKESIGATKDVSLDRAKDILKYQVGLLGSKVDYFKELFAGLDKTQENFQMVPMILALALNDMVFEEYGLEEEDLMKNVTDQIIMSNPDFAALFKEMEMNIIKLMEQIGAIPEQLSQYMQAQSANTPQQNQSLPGAGGVLPGSNPMDMLQLQQYMQMQQMQQQTPKK